MCIFFFTLDHPVYCLIIATNRDEFLARPTKDAHWHNFSQLDPEAAAEAAPSILSGIDAHPSGGGTWLGISRSGRFGSLLNFTERPPPPPAPELGINKYLSRGELVRRWLVGNSTAVDAEEKDGGGGGPAHLSNTHGLQGYLDSVRDRRDYFPGFNLLVGQVEATEQDAHRYACRLGYVSNRTQGADVAPLILQADQDATGQIGTGSCTACGLSNSVYQDPWAKVEEGKGLLKTALQEWDSQRKSSAEEGREPSETEEDALIEKLFTILGTNASPDIPAPAPSNIRSTIQVPPVRLPVSKPSLRDTHAPGTAALLQHRAPSSSSDTAPTKPQPQAPLAPPQDAAAAIAAAVAAGAELGWYGTRLSTVILVRRQGGQATFVERDVFELVEGGGQGEGGGVKRAEEKGRKGERKYRWTIEV